MNEGASMLSLMLALATAAAPASGSLEVRFQPADVVYVWENHGEGSPKDLYTAVVHNIAFVNGTQRPITLESVSIEARRNGPVVQSTRIETATLAASAQKFHALQKQGALDLYDFHFQTSRYLKGVKLASGPNLAPGEGLILAQRAFLFQTLPDRLAVTVRGRDAEGGSIEGAAFLRVVEYASKNDYHFPVRGRWAVMGGPSLNSHHRWAGLQEFAFDLIQFGEGGLSHSGDGSSLEQFYAYGKPVYSIGDGVVVAASDGAPESSKNLQQPGESAEAYQLRTMQAQQSLMLEGGITAVLGNHVIVRHAGGEHSVYVHLKTGSVAVKPGDSVKRGQQIGSLGHSGNSTEPHLHFHVTDGPDMAYSRSLPVAFTNITLWPSDDGTVKHLHWGQIVVAE